MAETPPEDQLSWSAVVTKGRTNATVPRMLTRKSPLGQKERLEHSIIFETPDIQQKWLTQRAAAIIQNSLHPDTVLFELRANDFEHYTDAYRLLIEKIGPLKGNGARPISRFGNALKPELIIETKFETPELNKKAVTEGFQHKGVLYKAVPAGSKTEGNRLQTVTLSQLPYDISDEEIVNGLRNSMRYFGKVLRVTKFTDHGWFEGEAKVSLDTNPVED
ncbi:hypothetical protein DM01DRAFT_1275115, partial [Hesseltinella vesiculosa]